MNIVRPEYIDGKWCPDCDDEMAFVGMTVNGIAQFFCGDCTYRRDRFEGVAVADRYYESQ